MTRKEFMARVIAWPGGTTPGYVNLHWTTPNPNNPDKPFWSGKPYATIDAFENSVMWATQRTFIKDIYFCLSTQSEIRKTGHGKIKAERRAENAVALKAIWLDVDVKEPPKGYPDLMAAMDAVDDFCLKAKLPAPSALIGSGGGLHVYWISDRSLTPAEWETYAGGLKELAIQHGLRCDAGVTTDVARVLRVPGTLNHKTVPAKEVKLLGMRTTDYDFSKDLAFLTTIPRVTVPVTKAAPAMDMSGLAGAKVATAFALTTESLADGVHDLLNPTPIMRGCAFLRDALLSGGQSYDQPKWNLTTLAAVFLDGGNDLAHKMGQQHPGYSRDTTEALWERKNREHKDRGIGWPSCAAIQTAGCKACQSCKYWGKIKSPLALAQLPTQGGQAPVTAAIGAVHSVVAASVPFPYPAGYGVDPKTGYPCRVIEEEQKGGQPPLVYAVPLLWCKITTAPWMQKNPVAINFTVSIDKGFTSPVCVKMSSFANTSELSKTLYDQGVVFPTKHISHISEFLMSFIRKLHEAEASMQSFPFGWYQPVGDKIRGFVYGGKIMLDDKTTKPAGNGDIEVRQNYTPCGTLKAWMDAYKMVSAQQSPQLECVMATAFAAPLMKFTGERNVMFSAYGLSGGNKSTAMKVAMAVWGHPLRTKHVQTSTHKRILNDLGEVHHLPIYWDEIADVHAQRRVFNTLFSASEGIDGGRMNRDITSSKRKEWQTLMCLGSNLSFIDYLTLVQKTTDAGINRAFEIEVPFAAPGSVGQIESFVASRLTQELETNFGRMGEVYAKMLANDPKSIDEWVMAEMSKFAKEVNQTKDERFWVAVCVTLLCGAAAANALGCSFDVPRMRAFLIDQYQASRAKKKEEATEGSTLDHIEDTLSAFLKAVIGDTIYTDTFPSGAVGRSSKPVNVLWGPRTDIPRACQVQWAVQDLVLRISRKRLYDYLEQQKMPPTSTMKGLKKHYGATVARGSLGANTVYRAPQERIITIPVVVGSQLYEVMNAHKDMEAEPTTTGLTNAVAAGVAQAAADAATVEKVT